MFNPIKQAMTGIDTLGSLLDSAKGSSLKEDFVDQDFESNPLTDFLSHGAGLNEISTTYTHGSGTHQIRLLNLVSPDIMLVHQSRMVGFYRKLGNVSDVKEVSRDIKNALIKDTLY